jgi:hypothetical protein
MWGIRGDYFRSVRTRLATFLTFPFPPWPYLIYRISLQRVVFHIYIHAFGSCDIAAVVLKQIRICHDARYNKWHRLETCTGWIAGSGR